MDEHEGEPGYLPRSEVANLVGVSVSTVRRWVEAGDVRAEQRGGGTWFVHLDDAEQRRAVGAGFTPNANANEPVDPQTQLFAQATKHFSQMGRYIDTLHGPAERLLKLLADENERLRDRCKMLEDRHVDNVTLYEKMVSEQHERHLSEMEATASQLRKTEAWKTLLHYAPTVATMVANHAGGAAVAGPIEEGALRQMVSELDSAQLQSIARAMPPHMGALLVQVHKHTRGGRHDGTQEKQATETGNGQAA